MPVHTLNDLKGKEKKDDKNRPGRGEETYAGGASSGLAVQNPDRAPAAGRGAGATDWRQRIIDTAREHGARDESDSDSDEKDAHGAGRPAQPRTFEGQGRRLGLTPSDPAVQAGTAAPQATGATAAAAAAPAGRRRIDMRINLWEDGFSVEDGPLRRFDDPANQEFLQDMNTGRIPRELERQVIEEAKANPNLARPELHIQLAPQGTPYAPAPKVFKAFGGSGKSLATEEGGSSANAGSSSGAGAGAGGAGAGAAPAPAVGSAPKLSIDESKEATTLQIRLADGTRLQARFNLEHTVGDIRAFINNARPGQRQFDIITPMPRQVFSDDSQTIAQAGLKGAAIVQHVK